VGRFDEIEAEFQHIIEELKRLQDFQERRLLIHRMGELIKEAESIVQTKHKEYFEKWSKPPQV
jgi:hypothetical protein